jgi:hypothetical protein
MFLFISSKLRFIWAKFNIIPLNKIKRKINARKIPQIFVDNRFIGLEPTFTTFREGVGKIKIEINIPKITNNITVNPIKKFVENFFA